MDQATLDRSHINRILVEAFEGRINNLADSVKATKKALEMSRRMGDKPLIAKSLSHLSLFYMILGEYSQCMTKSKEAIQYYEELGDEKGVADAKYNIAGVYYKTDNYHLGLVYLLDCLTVYHKYQDLYNISRVEKSLGTIYEYFGDQKRAIKAYKNSIRYARKIGDTNLESNAYNPLSGIYLSQNKISVAREMIEKSISLKEKTGDIRGLAFALYSQGKLHAKTGFSEKAEEDFLESLKIHEAMGEKLGIGMCYHKLGSLYKDLGRFEQAVETLLKGVEFGMEYNIAFVKYKCHYLLYVIYKERGDSVKALEYLEKYFIQKEAVIDTQTLKVIENYEMITRMETIQKEAQLQREKAEIIEKKNLAEQTSRLKQDFLSTMSHEIRTPLNAVITITSLLSEKTSEEDKQLLDSLKFSANNLLLIINDILDFTKLEEGKVHLERSPSDFNPLLRSICQTYDSLAREKGLSLVVNIGEGIAPAYLLDETKLSQILGNLVSNAIKFTEKGKVIMEVEKIAENSKNDRLRFRVIDTGVGIEKDYLSKIFDSFTQAKSITTRKQGGSGLGLAIVKKLVNLHGSDVLVKSLEGKGSTFHFDLDLQRCEVPIKSPAKTSRKLEGKLVLLAEDNQINAMVARKLLSNWGIQTEHARDGIEVLEMTKHKVFDCILMDIHMPEVNGFDATREIRNGNSPNKGTPIFALSADITAKHEEKYSEYFDGFLLKPIEREKLYQALTETHRM